MGQRPLDRGLVSAVRAALRAIVPPSKAALRPSVRAVVLDGAGGVEVEAVVRWRTPAGVVGHRATARDPRAVDGGDAALARVLAKLERARIGATTPIVAKRRGAATIAVGPKMAKPARARRGGQLARGSSASLRARIASALDASVPAAAEETERTLDLYRIGPEVFRARVVLGHRTARGKRGALRVEATGRGKDEALAALLRAIEAAAERTR